MAFPENKYPTMYELQRAKLRKPTILLGKAEGIPTYQFV
jgi:hypothetical protein